MGPRLGCLGGGQLGRMLALAGYPLGLRFTFLEPAADSCAGQVGEQLVGDYDDPRLLAELAEGSDLVTFEFESVPDRSAKVLSRRRRVFPPPLALQVSQDRLQEKLLFQRLGLPTAAFRAVDSPEGLLTSVQELGLPARLKTRRLGYDGHGQARLTAGGDLETALGELAGEPAILEREVAFERELSVIGVRTAGGVTAFYPLTENHHQQSVLRLSLSPAPGAGTQLQAEAERICAAIMDSFDYVGVLTAELFQAEGRLYANEIAPRVHNSGHWTLDGAVTSQFENHLRAGLGWPLGSTAAGGYSAMVNLLGELPDPAAVAGVEGAHLHVYGKAPRPRRKLGHVNLVGPDPERVTAAVQAVGGLLGAELPAPLFGASFWPT